MKKTQLIMFTFFLCASMSFTNIEAYLPPDFDYIISDTYKNEVALENEESLLVIGEGAHRIDAYNYSHIQVIDTSPLQMHHGGIGFLNLNDNSTLIYQGGQTGELNLYDDATAVLQGGSILYIGSFQNVSGAAHIEIICQEFNHNETTNLLTGTWVDNTEFSIQLVDIPDYTPAIDNIAFTIIPEPVSLLLLGMGGVLLKLKND